MKRETVRRLMNRRWHVQPRDENGDAIDVPVCCPDLAWAIVEANRQLETAREQGLVVDANGGVIGGWSIRDRKTGQPVGRLVVVQCAINTDACPFITDDHEPICDAGTYDDAEAEAEIVVESIIESRGIGRSRVAEARRAR